MDIDSKTQKENEARVAEEYLSSLSDLNCNSKPLINMLTMLADENIDYASVIVNVVQNHIAKVPPEIKLPILYLIDSIIKNVKSTYVQLFSQCIVNIFCGVFETVNEKIRERMYALRQTWNEVFTPTKLYALDVKVKRMDNNWPITAKPPQPSIHVNPNFLKQLDTTKSVVPGGGGEMEEILQAKTRELLELKKRKLELELEATKKRLEEQEKQLTKTTEGVLLPQAKNAAGANVDTASTTTAAIPGQIPNPALRQSQNTQNTITHGGLRPGTYNPNFRHARPQGFGPMPNALQTMQQTGFGGNMPANAKTKVNPVNPVLLNSLRHRDPRLARQNQQQQQQTVNQTQVHYQNERNTGNANSTRSDEGHKTDDKVIVDSTTSYRGSSRSRTDPMERKSNTNRSIGRSSKTSSNSNRDRDRDNDRDKDRDRDRDRRRRNESKSSSSSSASGDRRKTEFSAISTSSSYKHPMQSEPKKSHNNNNEYKDNFEIAPLSSTYKRKSSSPAGSPSKAKDMKRSSKTRNYSSRSKHHHSRSPSPRSIRGRSNSSGVDSDVRKHSSSPPPVPQLSTTEAALSTAITSPSAEKRRKMSVNSEHESKEDLVRVPPFSNAVTAVAKDLEKNARLALETAPTTTLPNATKVDIDLRQLLNPPMLSNIISPTIAPATNSCTTNVAGYDLASHSMSEVFLISDEESCNANDNNNTRSLKTSSSTIETTTTIHTTNTATTMTTTKIPKVSFKIQKLFNKLEKSTENLSTASSATTSTTNNNSNASANTTTATMSTTTTTTTSLNACKNIPKRLESKFEDDVNIVENKTTTTLITAATIATTTSTKTEEDKKKRIASIKEVDEVEDIEEGEPIAKKSKTSKIDALFGTEDVDLRTAVSAPPPPTISADDHSLQIIENWDNLKAKNVSPEKQHGKKASTLDDVRAKLAKAAKYNKLGKFDKINKMDGMQRLNKLAELNMNEDTSLEANDEKIRTIISQAQEMLETNAIDHEQYKNLVQTVMCINESNKLKEAKRRESLNAQKTTSATTSTTAADEERINDAERMAARDAVLKKRIPKIAKKLMDFNERNNGSGGDNASPLSDGTASSSPLCDDKNEEDVKVTGTGIANAPKPPRERRNKPSKWGERVVEPTAAISLNLNHQQQLQQQRPWMGNPLNKRGAAAGIGNFRATAPNPPIIPLLNPNVLRMPTGPWHMGASNVSNNIPFMHSGGSSVPPPPQPPPSLMNIPPSLPPKPCNSIDNPQADMVRTITIDGAAKEIRIYDQVAIVFMELDQPREIGFQSGQRNIYIDNQDPISLQFNDDYKPFTIDGTLHRLRFGFPSRELYIDDQWYEIYFGGSPVSIPIGNRVHIIKAEGPPPQVNIGPLRRDLVVGKINMIVDAHIVVPLFLDARLQICQLGDSEHTIQFADNLLTVLLDGEQYQVEYGGLPKSYPLNGKKYFIRFGALPKGVVAGKVLIKDMTYIKTTPPSAASVETMPLVPALDVPHTLPPTASSVAIHVEAMHGAENKPMAEETTGNSSTDANNTVVPPILPTAAFNNINIDELFQKLVSSGILSSALPVAPVNTSNVSTNETEDAAVKTDTSKDVDVSKQTESSSNNPAIETPQKPLEPICSIDLQKSESIKTRQAAIIASLYTGMQCSSCGVRFPPEQTMKYSQHLDWHFRQNRRERDASRKAHFRKWYYDLSDWVQYEEIEDLDEREKNFFEAQQNDVDTFDDVSNQRSTNSPAPSCAAGPDDVDRKCDMCHEKFEQFYNEELEEWHLRSAKRIEDKIYHPLCYEDYKTSLNPPKEEPQKPKDDSLITDDDNAVDIDIKVESAQKIEVDSKASVTINDDDDDDDDDVIVLPNEEPSVTEIVDDEEEEYVPINVTREEMGGTVSADEQNQVEDKILIAEKAALPTEIMESDVEIQEPHIPFTDLDNYEEKTLPEPDENSQLSFMNVKIKEEPKDDDEDEDDGFEDVGTVVLQPDDEISLHSSETQTQTIISLNSANSPHSLMDRPASAASQHDNDINAAATTTTAIEIDTTNATDNETGTSATVTTTASVVISGCSTTVTPATAAATTTTTTVIPAPTATPAHADLKNTMDADFESETTEHNLSAAGPAPLPIPLASLVNKIKINITKNINSSHNNNNIVNSNTIAPSTTSITTTATSTANTTSGTSSSNGSSNNGNISHISSIGSTIPVLCSSGSTMNKYPTSSIAMSLPSATTHNSHNVLSTTMANRQTAPLLTTLTPSNVSSISVIGSSYGSSHHTMANSSARLQPNVIKPIQPQSIPTTTATIAAVRQAKTPSPPIEDTITFEQKPALKQAQLKKMKKIERGVETSGLCSIM